MPPKNVLNSWWHPVREERSSRGVAVAMTTTYTVPTTRPILRAAALSDSVLSGASFGERLLLVARLHLPPELDHLFLKFDHSLGAHGCQSDEFHDYGPYPAMAGEGFVELREPVVEFPSDNGFWVERHSPHFAECREIGCFFRIGHHLASVGPSPRPVYKHRLCPYSPNCRHQRDAVSSSSTAVYRSVVAMEA